MLATPESVGVETATEQQRVGEDGDAEEPVSSVPAKAKAPGSPRPRFSSVPESITRPADAATFVRLHEKDRQMRTQILKRDRLDWPLTAVEKQFCRKLENRLLFEKDRRRSIP